MEVYNGLTLSPGVAIASAARLTAEFGLPQLAPERLRRIGEFLQKAGLDLPEPDQVILVAPFLPPGFGGAAMPGLEIVGMALEMEQTAAPACPAVANIGDGLLTQTEEGEIVIVDGDRGRVFVSPDAQTLARYQGPARRARRFFLEPQHVAARRGSNGLKVSVLAAAVDWEDLQTALAGGADGILVPEQNSLLGTKNWQTASEQLMALQDVMALTGGKLLLVQVPLERVALSALARAAASGPVHLAAANLEQARAARTELNEMDRELEAQDRAFGRVAVEAVLREGECPAPDELGYVDGVLTTTADNVPGNMNSSGFSVTGLLECEAGHTDIARWLDAGATRLVTSPANISRVKDWVRES